MSSSSLQLLLGLKPWTEFDTISFGGLVVLLLIMLRNDWKAPIPLGVLIGLIAGLLLGFGIEIISSSGQRLVSAMTRELPIVGMVVGLLFGLMGKLLSTPIPPEAKPTLPDSNQPPTS